LRDLSKKGGSNEIKLPPGVIKLVEKRIKVLKSDNSTGANSNSSFGSEGSTVELVYHPSTSLHELFDEALDAFTRNIEKEQLPKFMKSLLYIMMYNKMSLRQPYELPEELWQGFIVASEGGVEDGWNYVTEKKGLLVHKKQFENSTMSCIRSSCVMPIPIEEMHTFCVSVQLRNNWDSLFSGGRIIEKLDDKTFIYVVEYRPPFWAPMFNNHDCLMIRTEREEPDGTVLIINRSVSHPNFPERRGWNRTEVDMAGWVLRPCGSNSCVIIYTTQVQFKGIPKWAETKMINKRALLPYKIRKFIEKELKNKKKIPAWKQDGLW